MYINQIQIYSINSQLIVCLEYKLSECKNIWHHQDLSMYKVIFTEANFEKKKQTRKIT